MRKRFIAGMVTAALLLALLPATALAAGSVSYVDAAGAAKTCTDYTTITAGTSAWGSSGSETWYVADTSVTVTERITVNGNVNLILADGATLTTGDSITINDGAVLTVYAQSGQSGTLEAKIKSLANSYYNGIYMSTGGKLELNGGILTSEGCWNGCAAIGSGRYSGGGTVIVNNGMLIATGGNSTALRTTLYVNGGNVVAVGGNNGEPCFAGSLYLNGGIFEAKGHSGYETAKVPLPTSATGVKMKVSSTAYDNANGESYLSYSEWSTALQTAKYVLFMPCTEHTCGIDVYCDGCNLSFEIEADPQAGSYTENQSVTLSAETGMDIYYTVDGSHPKVSGIRYTAPIQIAGTEGQDITKTILAYAKPVNGTCADAPVTKLEYNISIPMPQYTVAVSANSAAGGMVAGDGTYYKGDTATVTAAPNNGYSFVNWTENGSVVSTDAIYTFTVDGDRTLVANFALNTHTVKAVASPTDCGTVDGSGTYNWGDSATVTATPNNGYNFVNWTENGSEVSDYASYSFTVDGDRDLVANFALKTHDINIEASPTEGGAVTGGGEYNWGDTVTVTATPNNGYSFVSWTENDSEVSTDASYTFIAEADRNLVAVFHKHSLKYVYQDGTEHWQECTDENCTDADKGRTAKEAHSFDDEADAECICGYTRHVHAWADSWSGSDTHHWHECSNTGCPVTDDAQKDGYGEHVYDDGICECGKVEAVEDPNPKPQEPKPNKPSGSSISVTYKGGNTFSASKSAMPTSVEIDGVPVGFVGDGRSFTVDCLEPGSHRITVRWHSTSVTTNFVADAGVVCIPNSIPKTGDISVIGYALMSVIAAAAVVWGKK